MTTNLVLISGGPGLLDARDTEHDQSWANYVTCPILLQRSGSLVRASESVWWFVYKPAYVARWEDDVTNKRSSVDEVKKKGFTSYVDMIQRRAEGFGWNLRWLSSAADVWTKLATFADPISRVFFWGHARDDLWLSLRHRASDGEAIAPATSEILAVTDIDASLAGKFSTSGATHRFVGCNTKAFAQAWSSTYSVCAEGVEGKVDFGSIMRTNGEPSLVSGAARVRYCDGAERAQESHLGPTEAFAGRRPGGLPRRRIEGRLVDAADAFVESSPRGRSSNHLLAHLIGDVASAFESSAETLSHGRPCAAELFDSLAVASPSGAARFFEVIVPPRGRVPSSLRPGDLIVTRALGEGRLAHVAVTVTGELVRGPARARLGTYVHVIEAAPTPAPAARARLRMLMGESGILGHDRMIVRLLGETGTPPTIEFHLWQEWHQRAAVSTTYRGPTSDDRRVVEDLSSGATPSAKPSLHLCFQEKAAATLSIDVGTGTYYAKWQILNSSNGLVREHPTFSAANYGSSAAAALLSTGKYSWVWDGRNNASNPVFVAAGTYKSRITIKESGSSGGTWTYETTLTAAGSPYTIRITGQPKNDADLDADLARPANGGRLLSTTGERVGRDCWLLVHRGLVNDGHAVFLGQGTVEATIAEDAPRWGAIATPHGVAFKGWIRPNPHGAAANADRVQIESVGATNAQIALPLPAGGTPTPTNPYADGGPGPYKDGVQAHAGNAVWTTNGLSVGCTTTSPIGGATCTLPGSQFGALRSINSQYGTWGNGTTEDVSVRGPVFENKQNKASRTGTTDALLDDDHASPLLDPPAPSGCGATADEPLHMQSTAQRAVFGGFLGHEIPRSQSVADAPANQLQIRMTLATYGAASKYHQYHHALAFGHDYELAGGAYEIEMWIPRKVIRGWNANRRNVLVRGHCEVIWYVEHVALTGVTSVVHSFRGTGPSTWAALANGDVGRMSGTWTPPASPAAGQYTSVLKYKLDLRPFVSGDDEWVAEAATNDRFSTHAATLAAETLSTSGGHRYASGESRLTLLTVP